MSKYQSFRFKRYEFKPEQKQLNLYYGYDDVLEFRETYGFNFDFVDYDPPVLERAIELLFFTAGVSYFKAYVTPEIKVESGKIDQTLADYLGQTYQRGLGEFFYVNRLDPHTPVNFPVNSQGLPPLSAKTSGHKLVGLGGGKDSVVSVEALRDQVGTATWSLNHQSQLQPLVERVGLPHYWVERSWDEQLHTLNQADALNGHVPISAIFAAVGAVVCILGGYGDNVVSNESSSSEPALHYDGLPINHQYSKSLEFEKAFQAYLKHSFGDSLRYYSFLRPFSELRIAELFAKRSFKKYKDVFSSCNRAFTHDQNHMFWCGECAKCAFVFLMLAPFLEREELESLWGGKNLLKDPTLETTYKNLLGIEGDKPLDCVGEVKEARAAMRLATEKYPELARYEYELPESYDFRAWSAHSMPNEIYEILKAKVN